MTRSQDTIAALSSGPGRAGVAVVRVSGPAAASCIEQLSGKAVPQPRTAVLRALRRPGSGEMIDRALVLWMPGPGTFTGGDVVEFHVHGGRAVVTALLEVLLKVPGVRAAEPGEFTLRAFRNGRIDLTAAEGLADLIDAETEAQRRQAVALSGGLLGQAAAEIRADLIRSLALMEAVLDFADEADVTEGALKEASDIGRRVMQRLQTVLAGARHGEIVRDGFRVVLAGAPNAGKSSLLNALARRDVAIVSPEPGTTRDVIEVRLDLGGHLVIVADTAGLRQAAGAVEAEGMRRTIERARTADLTIWVVDATAPVWTPDAALSRQQGCTDSSCIDSPIFLLRNKIDLVAPDALAAQFRGAPARIDADVSGAIGHGVAELVAAIEARAKSSDPGDGGVPVATARQRQLIENAIEDLAAFLDGSPDLELRAEHLRRAAFALGRLVGHVDVEDVLGQIFGRFCIGK
ncbi:MAG: tRNA uridine-5-carboxymethylaminomethyl(34) synthesis GTPase MnmE [Hyphomicrobiales bacterium]|nr:tRNA uridine-5-carboxymethylaminomethyl(34) synthesis GTPase MnmE [Hyphomicrobiales bacterium]